MVLRGRGRRFGGIGVGVNRPMSGQGRGLMRLASYLPRIKTRGRRRRRCRGRCCRIRLGRGPSKNKRYGPILDPSLLISDNYDNNNNNNDDSDDDDVIEPKLDKYYISNFLSFLPEDLVKDVMGQRINSRQSTILKYLRQRYDCYPPQIYKLVTGHRLSNKDLRQYRLRQHTTVQQQQQQHDQHHLTPPASLAPTPLPTQAPPPPLPPPVGDTDEHVDAATQLEQLMHDYHSAESVMADVFDEMSRVVANTVTPTTHPPNNQRIAHKAILPPASPSYIPHKQMMPPSPPLPPSSHIPYKQMPPPTPPPSSSSPSSSSSLSSVSSPPPPVLHNNHDEAQPTTNHYQDLLDSMDMYLNNLPSSPPSSHHSGNTTDQQQQQQQQQSFTSVLNAYCDGYFNAKETVNEVLHVAQQYLMNTWDQQGGM